MLFWTHPEIWYHVDQAWLVYDYGRPGSEPHCPEFARQIHQVEVSFEQLDYVFHESESRNPGRAATLIGRQRVTAEREAFDTETMAKLFWEAFQVNFPAATQVVLSETWARKQPAPFPKEFVQVIRACPPGVTVRLSLIEFFMGCHRDSTRTLYKLGSGKDASLELVQRDWFRNRVMLPTKKFSGPVGTFQRLSLRSVINECRYNAIRQARFKAYESFHFGGHKSIPIKCPEPKCDVVCTVEGEWVEHAISTDHDECHSEEEEYPEDLNLD